MNTHADKTQENKSQTVANAATQKQSRAESTFQFLDNRPEAIAQRRLHEMVSNSPQGNQATQLQAMANNHSAQQQQPNQKIKNNTNLPDNLKLGIENLSGYSMDDVKVHYNSEKPAQLHAHAYTQGTDIHLSRGQEKHLPHEAWHVLQQKQGRVKPTMQLKDTVNINDDSGLEQEADVMGAKALSNGMEQKQTGQRKKLGTSASINDVSRTDEVFQLVKMGSFDIDLSPKIKWNQKGFLGAMPWIMFGGKNHISIHPTSECKFTIMSEQQKGTKIDDNWLMKNMEFDELHVTISGKHNYFDEGLNWKTNSNGNDSSDVNTKSEAIEFLSTHMSLK